MGGERPLEIGEPSLSDGVHSTRINDSGQEFLRLLWIC
jgi:hypothetical protein